MIKNNKPITANEKMNVEHEVFISTREGRVCFEEITHKKVKDKITNKNYLVSYGKLIGDNESVCMIIEQGKEPLFFGYTGLCYLRTAFEVFPVPRAFLPF